MRLTTICAGRKPRSLIRSQPHMYPMAACSWLSLSPLPLPSRWEGGVALSPEPLPQKGFLWFSAEVLLHEGAFERLEQHRAPLDAFLLAIDFVNKIGKVSL